MKFAAHAVRRANSVPHAARRRNAEEVRRARARRGRARARERGRRGSTRRRDVPPREAGPAAPARRARLSRLAADARRAGAARLRTGRCARARRARRPGGPARHGASRAATRAIVLDLHGDWHSSRAALRFEPPPVRRAARGPAREDRRASRGRRAHALRLHHRPRARGRRRAASRSSRRSSTSASTASCPACRCPRAPTLLFVGVLEDYKGIDVLAEAWREAAPRVPDAELRLVGRGAKSELVEELLVDLPRQTRWYPAARRRPSWWASSTRSTALVLPSRSEGLPRIVLESFCRGRPVVAARAGGVVDLVRDGENGVLVDVEDAGGARRRTRRRAPRPRLGRRARGGSRTQRSGLARDTRGVRSAGSRPRRLPRLIPCAQSGRSSS